MNAVFMNKDTDARWVKACVKGDIRAFENLVDKYQKPVFNIVYRMCHDYEDARDITQGVFVRAYQNLKSFTPKFKFFSWIYRIAINETLNHLDKKKDTAEISEFQKSDDKNPEENYTQMELNENIQQALLKIDSKYRALILLKHFQNYSYQRISEIMDLPEKTVKSRLFSARQQLGKVLTKQGVN